MRPRPCCLHPAQWAHLSWLEPDRRPADERAWRQASLQLLERFPQLARSPGQLPPIPRGRPAFARLCRLVAACAMPVRMRGCIGTSERRAMAMHLGRHALDALQRQAASPAMGDVLAQDPTDRLAMTAAGLRLLRIGCSARCETLWLALRLPRALSEAARPSAIEIDVRCARAAVARARWLWRVAC